MLAAASAHAEPQPSLATVLDRAAAYVDGFERQLSGIVAEEHYVQEVPDVREAARLPVERDVRRRC